MDVDYYYYKMNIMPSKFNGWIAVCKTVASADLVRFQEGALENMLEYANWHRNWIQNPMIESSNLSSST